MKAAVYEKFQGPIIVQNVPDPKPNDHGVIISVKATGLCRSDWHGWMGHDADIELPHVPGHEFAGTVEFVGKNVKNFKVGDRVTAPFVCGCGSCRECISGNHQVCDSQSQPGFTHWGSFAQYVALDYADINLVKLPEEIKYVTAAILGCRFVTSYRAIVDQGKVSGGQYVAVHGCGGVGLSAIMIAHALGAQVIAVDIKDESLELAKKLGAKVLAGELEIIGSHGMQAYKYPEMLEMIKNGRLRPEKLIEKTISLQEATVALPGMNSFDNKGVLVIDSF